MASRFISFIPKHGPALGEHVAARIVEGGPVETRFSLATKGKVQKRAVY